MNTIRLLLAALTLWAALMLAALFGNYLQLPRWLFMSAVLVALWSGWRLLRYIRHEMKTEGGGATYTLSIVREDDEPGDVHFRQFESIESLIAGMSQSLSLPDVELELVHDRGPRRWGMRRVLAGVHRQAELVFALRKHGELFTLTLRGSEDDASEYTVIAEEPESRRQRPAGATGAATDELIDSSVAMSAIRYRLEQRVLPDWLQYRSSGR